jgi:hypothetical protein
VKAAVIIIALLAVDILAVWWTQSGLPSTRGAWQKIRDVSDGFGPGSWGR